MRDTMCQRCKDGGEGGMRREESGGGGHTQKLTRESALCAVSEPEASPYSVSLRVAFVSVFVAPDHFLPLRSLPSPPPARRRYVLLFRPVLFRESSSRQERTRTLSSARHDKGELCTILWDATHSYRAFSLLSQSWRVRKNRGVRTRTFFFSAQCIFECSTLQPDWWMVSRFAVPFSLVALYLSAVNEKFYVFPTMLHVFHGFIVQPCWLMEVLGIPSEKRKHALGTRGSGLRQVNGIIPYFSIKRGK